MTIAVVHYTRFYTPALAPTPFAVQELFINQNRTHNSVNYQYAPFRYSGGASAEGGDRSEARFVAVANPLMNEIVAEAVEGMWLVEVRIVQVNEESLAELGLIRTELWRCASYELNTERLEMQLRSPLDLITDQVPSRTLSASLVGALPATGRLVLQ
jgi:hypothetical protein